MANAVITKKGLALLAKLPQGTALEITSAKTGMGTVDSSSLQDQTGVASPKQTLAIQNVSYQEDGKCSLILSVTNEGVASSYTIMQLGIFAKDPDEGEVLFSIYQVNSGDGINIPSETILPGYNAEWSYNIKFDMADNVNVNVDPSNMVTRSAMEAYVGSEVNAAVKGHNESQTPHDGVLAKQSDFSAHTANKNNPHGVTAAQLNLAKVATSGSYNDLGDKPSIPAAYSHPSTHPASMITGLSAVATSGSYNDLSNKPTIPAAYSHPSTHPASMITGLSSVATSGSYNDLSNKPTMPSSLPANGGNADTVDNLHASDFAPASHATSKNNPHEVTAEQVGTVPTGDIPNLHIWEKHSADPKGYTETEVSEAIVGTVSSDYYQVWYSSEVSIVDGKFSTEGFELVSSTAIADFLVVKGNYVINVGSRSCYYVPEDAVLTKVSSGVSIRPAVSLSVNNSQQLGYVADKAGNTYPTNGTHSDGNWYKYSGQLGETPYSYGTKDLAAGVSPLATGKLYFVYE